MPEDILRLEGVRKSYGRGTPTENEVLHGIDLRIAPGEFVALMGPSGSGKSTLLNVIGLLDRPDSGKLFVEGRETSQLTDVEVTKVRGHSIGFVFQYHYLIPAFTAIENVMMPMLLDRGHPTEAMRESARALLEKVGLAAFTDKFVNNLSGGQQQRVAVARALAMGARLILADEPTGNLDTKSADGVFELMRSVNAASGTTFLVVTHSPRMADRCDRLIELVDGRIVADRPRLDSNQAEPVLPAGREPKPLVRVE